MLRGEVVKPQLHGGVLLCFISRLKSQLALHGVKIGEKLPLNHFDLVRVRVELTKVVHD